MRKLTGELDRSEPNEKRQVRTNKIYFITKLFFLEKTNDVTDILMEYSSRRSTSREKDNRGIEREV